MPAPSRRSRPTPLDETSCSRARGHRPCSSRRRAPGCFPATWEPCSPASSAEPVSTRRLMAQRRASPNTVAAYRDTFRLLLGFVLDATGTPPARLQLENVDAPLIGAFLDHLEHQRGVAPSTRNARLAAIRSLFCFA